MQFLSAFDYFGDIFPTKNVNFIFTVSLFLGINLISFLLYHISKKIDTNKRIIGALLFLGLLNIVLPIQASLFSGNLGK